MAPTVNDGRTIGLRVDGVSKRYVHRVKGAVYAARDVRLDVAPGEFVTLLGPSGCGKTTTLRMIAGFEKPDGGRIRFGGDDVTELPANRRDIGFVFQNYALFPHLSVRENVAYGLEVRGLSAAEIARRVADVLELVGLAGYEHQFSAQLSGGEQQRVALARAIVIRPRVLLFDEPLSNLDARLRVQMRTEIRELQRRLAITTVYVTHDQEEAMAVSDRIAVMNRGSIVQEGSAEDLYYRPASEFVATFIGRVNLLAGRVLSADRSGASVSVLGATLRAGAGSGPWAAGSAVKLVLRPEAIELRRAGETPIAATVESRAFLGEKAEYQLRCGGERLQAVRYESAANAHPAGATVSIAIPEDTIVLLPAEAS
ncbi:MAG: ABC transporter ATP-binding protein [Burkholderiales bacterium]|nr:ABC transporter ATP-binding protein [Burkholderiales bacterium]